MRDRERENSVLFLFLASCARLFAPYPFASSPFCALHRSCAHALPCFSRHFSLSRRAGSAHLVRSYLPFVFLISEISPVSESPLPYFVYRATRSSRYRSRTDSSLQPFVRAISHPVRTDLHRATEDRIETPLKREGEKRWRCMRHSAFYGRERSPLSDPQQRAAARPPPSAPGELQRSPAGFCRTLQIFRLAGIDGNPFTVQLGNVSPHLCERYRFYNVLLQFIGFAINVFRTKSRNESGQC